MNVEIYNKLILENKPNIDELMRLARPEPDDPEYLELKGAMWLREEEKDGESNVVRIYQQIASGKRNADGSVDIDEDVDMRFIKLSAISDMAIFGIVNGDFKCDICGLVSLQGAPRECRNFHCGNNSLTNLKGAPEKCKWFFCSSNDLTTLTGSPTECSRFECQRNRLTTLEGAVQECEWFDCQYNHLMTLEGGPVKYKHLICSNNPISADQLLKEHEERIRNMKQQ